jgi:hypothetical protein
MKLPPSMELKHGRSIACEARHEGDEWACACGLRWPVDDPEPPTCRRKRHISPVPSERRELLQGARREFVTPDEPIKRRKMPTPEELTDAQLDAMSVAACWQSIDYPMYGVASLRPAMRAAYRALLDSLGS